MEITLGKVSLLGTIASESAIDFKIQPGSLIQKSNPIGAKGEGMFDRGNDSYVITFGVSRTHETAEKALFFLQDHIDKVRAAGRDVLTLRSDEGTKFYYPAICAFGVCSFEGATTLHAYSIQTGAMSSKAPSAGSVGSGALPTNPGGVHNY